MKIRYIILFLFVSARLVSAYDNASMTDDFRELVGGNIFSGIQSAYVSQWGNWVYFILILIPYVALYMSQQSLTPASIWLVSCLVAYRYLLDGVTDYITYLLIVIWVLSVIRRVTSPVYES